MTALREAPDALRLDFAPSDERTGFRLARLEVLNWGTFDERVWRVDAGGRNTLLTGDNGSGKSTLVDALTTLLAPPQKLSYNLAAGAEARERTRRSYVLGHFKSERGEGAEGRPVPMRTTSDFAVLLGVFENEGFSDAVTLAQVFWFESEEGQPKALYVVADGRLSVKDHFSGFGTEIGALRKRLKGLTKDVYDSFPPYAGVFRRRFGLASNDQALELFHQAVSMKTVGNLTEFVREHMLQPFPVENRIDALIRHFDDLVRAHDAVLKAKAQIAKLEPLVADCDRIAEMKAGLASIVACERLLAAWFAAGKKDLLAERVHKLEAEIAAIDVKLSRLADRRHGLEDRRDRLRSDIAASGGDRLEQIRRDVQRLEVEREDRSRRAEQYAEIVRGLGLEDAIDAERFAVNAREAGPLRERASDELEMQDREVTDASVQFQSLRKERDALQEEIDSLKRRRSNIPANLVALRARLCCDLGLEEDVLPFAGELIQVRAEDRAWEGAVERVLRGFGMSLLVAEAHYPRVAEWVEREHLGQLLVYFPVRGSRTARAPDLEPHSLVRKLQVKPDAEHCEWLLGHLARNYNYACCVDLAQFRREKVAVTIAGQVKRGGDRHEKDDRHRIDDRSRYVLGWTNDAKVAALRRNLKEIEEQAAAVGARISTSKARVDELRGRVDAFGKLALFREYRDLDWRTSACVIEELEQERLRIEAASDRLRALNDELQTTETELAEAGKTHSALVGDRGGTKIKLENCGTEIAACDDILGRADAEEQSRSFPALESMRSEALGTRALTVESAAAREREFATFLRERREAEQTKITGLGGRIVKAMEAYRQAYPGETKDADASLEAADEYRSMLRSLVSDDLPRFEQNFKKALNENAINEIAVFSGALAQERQLIKERIEEINGSLRAIEYNPGRYIVLETTVTPDKEIREFQGDLKACTEAGLTGSEDDAYSEAKFAQVKKIIELFRGREGLADTDRKWKRKVTDVRNWSVFAASEKWIETDEVHEHYSDSSGKSGGEKGKLAYTVLAASLAYQYGVKFGEKRSRSCRFVAIDEAFGNGSDTHAAYALELFKRLNLQLLVVTPLQKVQVIEPYVERVAFVHKRDGRESQVRNMTVEEYRRERAARAGL